MVKKGRGRYTLSKVYSTKAEARKHAERFRKRLKWESKVIRRKDGWGVYYR